TVLLIDIANEINNNISEMRKLLKSYSKGQRTKEKRNIENISSPENNATDVTNERKRQGFEGQSDIEEQEDPSVREIKLQKNFEEDGYETEDAKTIAELLVKKSLKYHFETRSVETSSFFTVKNKAGILIITLNSDHPAYEHLIELLEDEIKDDDPKEELIDRFQKARDGLLLLIAAWARFEDEQISENKRDQLKDIRSDWGKVARGFYRGSI
ncbi:MAG: hypothetical protein JXM74_10470, partial [Fusobacteriaceae bacterium]|nr:hypothetical protein [Fusobacteriaceae bacterium]